MDNKILTVTLPIAPSVNHSYKPRAFIAKGVPMVTIYKTSEAKLYQKQAAETIRQAVKKQGWISRAYDKNLFVIVEAVVHFPRIDMDVNNLWKVLLDSVRDSEMIIPDDNKILEKAVRVYYNSESPRIELSIYYAPYVGVFDNQDLYDRFVNKNCDKCSRQNRNCSIHKKALESRFQIEIDLEDLSCSKFKQKK